MRQLLHQASRAKHRLGPLWWHTGLMFCVSRVGDLMAFYIGVFLVPAVISSDDLGAILPLTRLSGLVGLPLMMILAGVLKYLSVFQGRGEKGKVKALLQDLAAVSAVFSIGVLLYLWWAGTGIQSRLRFEDPLVIWLVAAITLVSFWTPVLATAMQSLGFFYRITLSRLLMPAVRLLVILAALKRLQLSGYLLASLLSSLSAVMLYITGIRTYLGPETRRESYRSDLAEMARYFVPVGIMVLVMNIQLLAEPWIVRQWLSNADSAGFYIVCMFGNIPLWVAPAMLPFFFPLVSERFERGESTGRMHLQSLGVVFVVGAGIAVGFAVLGHWMLGLNAAWRPYQSYAPYIWQMCLITTGTVFVQCHTAHESACRKFTYLYYFAPASLLGVPALYIAVASGGGLGVAMAVMLICRAVMVMGVVIEVGVRYWRAAVASE